MKIRVQFFFVLGLFIFGVAKGLPQSGKSRDDASVSHAEIRDAILSLLTVLRDQMNKLERHEYRERQLGEQLTRTLNVIEKKTRAHDKSMDNLANQLSKAEERMQKVEQAVHQRNDRERFQLQKSTESIDSFRTLLQQNAGPLESLAVASDSMTKLVAELRMKADQMDETYKTRLEHMANEVKVASARTEQQMARLEEVIMSLTDKRTKHDHGETEKLVNAASNLLDAEAKWRQNIEDTEDINSRLTTSLAHLTEAVRTLKETSSAVLDPSARLATIGNTDNDVLNAILDAVEGLQKNIEGIENSMSNGKSLMEVRQQLDSEFRQLRTDVAAAADNVTANVDSSLGLLKIDLGQGQHAITQKVSENRELAEELVEKVQESHTDLAKEMKGLANVERVLLDTADSVLDTKRRIEYGIQQILAEVSETVKVHSGELNKTIHGRFDLLSTVVLHNQTMALKNLTTHMEREISQVWRQIGIMYHQLSLSANVLDKIHSQTQNYVNSSIKTMDSMEGKVGLITNRMGEVDENLNYLLGRLSLVTQEFNMIKTGIGEALVDLRESFQELESDSILPRKGSEENQQQTSTPASDNDIEAEEFQLRGSIN